MTQFITSVFRIPTTVKINNYFPPAQKFLMFLLGIDLLFIALHVYSFSLPVTDAGTLQLRLDMDFGYAEMFQYFQFCTSALLLTILFFRQRKGIYLIWSLFFLVLFFDDAFAFHETFGGNLVNFFNIEAALGLRAQDFGELAIAGMLGATFVLPFTHALFLGERKTREVTLHLILIVGVLVFFGVGVDMVHSLFKDLPGSGALTVIEDSGEMISGSLILCYCLCLHLRQNNLISSITKK
ncbi:hypothetical protein [Salinimicrobium marinum]|nr:hypothetical protein [Salinimicrobium marinum]